MKTEIEEWPNEQRKYEIPCVNGVPHGLSKWWHNNGQKETEIHCVNGKWHGLSKWWLRNGSVECLSKWHQDQRVWAMRFSIKEQILGDSEIELFFHPTLELS